MSCFQYMPVGTEGTTKENKTQSRLSWNSQSFRVWILTRAKHFCAWASAESGLSRMHSSKSSTASSTWSRRIFSYGGNKQWRININLMTSHQESMKNPVWPVPGPCGDRHQGWMDQSLQPCWNLVSRALAAAAACTCFHAWSKHWLLAAKCTK